MSLVTRLRTPAGGKSGFSRGGGREEEGGLNGGTQRVADGWPEGRRKWVVSPATTATFPPFSSAHTRSAVPSFLLVKAAEVEKESSKWKRISWKRRFEIVLRRFSGHCSFSSGFRFSRKRRISCGNGELKLFLIFSKNIKVMTKKMKFL